MFSNYIRPYNIFQRFTIILFVFDVVAWLLAHFSKYYLTNIEVYLDVLCFILVIAGGKGLVSNKNVEIAKRYCLACIAIILIPVLCFGDLPFVSVITKLLFAFSFISLRPDLKWAIYRLFVAFFTVLLLLGLVEWFLLLFGVNFFWATVERGLTQTFHQGIFILVPTYFTFGYYRFMSLCEEPGTLGTICFFFLATLDYKQNKKSFLVFLISGLLSFSLGFYVLLIIWVVIKNKQFNWSQIILGVVAVTFMLTMYGSFFEERIVERITDRDTISSIDNRTNEEVDKKLEEISHDYRLFVGMGNRLFYEWEAKVSGVSAGVKNFLLQYGVLGLLILVIAFSALIIRVRGFDKNTIVLVVFVWICFYKSNTWNNPPIMLPLLTVSIASLGNSNNKMSKNKIFAIKK